MTPIGGNREQKKPKEIEL